MVNNKGNYWGDLRVKGLSEWEEKHTSLVCVGLFLVSLLGTYFS